MNRLYAAAGAALLWAYAHACHRTHTRRRAEHAAILARLERTTR